MRLLKIILVNVAVFVGLIVCGAAILVLLPWEKPEDARTGKAALPNYAADAWAPQMFADARATSVVYYSYIGWRRRPFTSQYVNIVGKYGERLTIDRPDASDRTVFFFGGSTMWGTGSRDVDTIPSQFAQKSHLKARNFGETAYTAHQDLEMMIKLLQAGERPAAIVFYDGVNDVLHKCRSDLGPYSDAEETRTRLAVEPSFFHRLSWEAIGKLSTLFPQRQRIQEGYDCSSNPEKAAAIASAMVSDWKIAAAVAKLYDIPFYAVLQPVIYFSRTRKDYLNADGFSGQFAATYPKMRALIQGTPFLDYTDAFDRDAYIYIDFCHVSPNGNAIVAEKLARLLAPDSAAAGSSAGPQFAAASLNRTPSP